METYTIYKAFNIMNNKSYIGFDKKWPRRRKQHLYYAFKENCPNYNSYFHRAIRKYGKDAFNWEILYQSYDGPHCLKIMEPYFIKENASYCHWENGGYNMTLGGDGQLGMKGRIPWNKGKSGLQKWTDDRKMNQTPWNKGKSGIYSDEAREKMRVVNIGNKHCLGRIMTTETKRKISIGNANTWEVTSPNNEKYTIVSLNKFCKEIDLQISALSLVAAGERNHHKGWKCKKLDA